MSYAEIQRRETMAHKFVFRVSAINGSAVRILWEGDSLGEGENQAEAAATAARAAGSSETITLDGFRIDIEKRWTARIFTSRPPSVTPIRHTPGLRGRPRVLFLSLEFPTWTNGARSWSYSASLAYEAGLRAAGCDVTTINTACAPYHRKILRARRFDQVWFHCHPRHISDHSFREWVSDIAPVRLMLAGETVHYTPEETAASPWFGSHAGNYAKWVPHVTHAAFVDPTDREHSTIKQSTMWHQAVPASSVLPVNERPSIAAGVFVGSLYAPRDRWVSELGGLLEQVECPESDAFQWLFERSHEWIQRTFDRTRERDPWWARRVHGLYNRLQVGLRRHAFGNFIDVLRQGLAVVNLPSQVKGYSGRVIEGMAAGRPVLTPPISGPSVFEDGSEILHYSNIEELGEQIRRIKDFPLVGNSIAARARKNLLANHTVEKRTAELLSFVEGGA